MHKIGKLIPSNMVEINDGRASVPASTGNRKVAIPYCARRDADVVFDQNHPLWHAIILDSFPQTLKKSILNTLMKSLYVMLTYS